MEIKGTNVNLTQKIKEDSQAGKKLAKEMMLFADDNGAAVSKSEFQEKLNKMEKLSTQDLIKFIRSFDKDESVIELIVDEVGSVKNGRKDACKKVLSALTNKAKELGIDTKDFEQQFIKELDSQFNSWGTVNTEKLDKIINAITQSIENRQNFTAEDVQTVQNTPAEVGQEQANVVIENRLEKAYSAFGERVGEDGEMTDVEKVLINKATGEKTEVKYKDGQMQRDGLAADIADGVKKIFGSENTASKIREDLKTTNAQLQQLKEAKLQGEKAYKAKFKEIFGVEYDYANMVAYQKAEQTYINASANHEFEMMFNRTLKTLISPAPLREEFDYIDGGDGKVIATKTATKEQVYNREFNNLAEFLTQKDANGNEIKGSEILNAALAEKGVANGTMEEKFEVLKQIAKALSKEFHSATLEAGGGKEFSEVQSMYDNSYKAAYGVENDIMKRVTDYNISQEMGAGFVKAGATIGASLVAAFSGIGLVGVAAITAGATVGAEVIDRGTSGKALNALKEQGLGEYLETVGNDVDWEATLKQAAMSGGAVLIGGGVAQGVTAIMKGSSSVSQFAAMLGSDIVTDATLEFLTTKQITWQGMVFTVLLSTIGNAASLKGTNTTKGAEPSNVITANPKPLTTGNNINPKLKDVNNFIDFLKDSHISYDYVSDGNKIIVRISDDTRVMHNDRFDYYVFKDNQLTEVHTKAKSNIMGSDIEWNYRSGKSNSLNSGVNPRPIIESLEAHIKARELRALATDANSFSIVKSPFGNFAPIATDAEAEKVIDRLIRYQTNSLKDVDNGTITKNATFWDSGRKYWLESLHSIEEQGTKWKIHLYANNVVEYANVAELAIPYLKEQNKNGKLAFKTIRDIEHLKLLRNSVDKGDAQTGKAFTIYFKNEEDFIRTAKELENLFDNSGLKSSGKVKNEAQIGNSGFVSYRNELEPRLSSNYKPADMIDPLLDIAPRAPQIGLIDDSDVEIIAVDDEPDIQVIAAKPHVEEPEVEIIAVDDEPDIQVIDAKPYVEEPEVEIIAVDDEPDIQVIDTKPYVEEPVLYIDEFDKISIQKSSQEILKDVEFYKNSRAHYAVPLELNEGLYIDLAQAKLPVLMLADSYVFDLNDYAHILKNVEDGTTITIGRNSNSQVVKNKFVLENANSSISRNHITIEIRGGNLIINNHCTNGASIIFEKQNAINNTTAKTDDIVQLDDQGVVNNNIYNPDEDVMAPLIWEDIMGNNNMNYFDDFGTP